MYNIARRAVNPHVQGKEPGRPGGRQQHLGQPLHFHPHGGLGKRRKTQAAGICCLERGWWSGSGWVIKGTKSMGRKKKQRTLRKTTTAIPDPKTPTLVLRTSGGQKQSGANCKQVIQKPNLRISKKNVNLGIKQIPKLATPSST